MSFLCAGLMFSNFALAASDTVNFTADTNLNVWGSGITLVAKNGSTASAVNVYSTYITLEMEDGSNMVIRSNDRYDMTSSHGEQVDCQTNYSEITIAPSETVTVTLTPSTDTCSASGGGSASAGGGGGGGASYDAPEEEEEEGTGEQEEEEEEEETETKLVSEMSVSELKTEIVRISALIAELQEQLLTMLGREGTLTQNLKYGDSGSQVELLQSWLAKDAEIYPAGIVSGWFGPLTKEAVIRFQEKYASEILSPWGLKSGTGFVGETTREKLNALYAE